MTPLMKSGVRGISVMVVKSSTSRTLATSMPKTSLPSLKVRYCRVSVISLTLIVVSFRVCKRARAARPRPTSQKRSNSLSRLSPLSFSFNVTPDLVVGLGAGRRAVPLAPAGPAGASAARAGFRRCRPRAASSRVVAGAEEAQRAHQLIGLAGQLFGG